MFHYTASVAFLGKTEMTTIQLGKRAPPEEHCSVDEAQVMGNEVDIVIFQAGHLMTSDDLPSTQSTDHLEGEQSGV